MDSEEKPDQGDEWETGSLCLTPYLERHSRSRSPRRTPECTQSWPTSPEPNSWESEEEPEQGDEWESGSLCLTPYLERSRRQRSPHCSSVSIPYCQILDSPTWSPTSNSPSSTPDEDAKCSERNFEDNDEWETGSLCLTPYLERYARSKSHAQSPISIPSPNVSNTPTYSPSSSSSLRSPKIGFDLSSLTTPTYDPEDD